MRLPSAVVPIHDPGGLLLPQVKRIQSDLERLFGHTFLSVSHVTNQRYSDQIAPLCQKAHFKVLIHPSGLTMGQEFRRLYAFAAENCEPDDILHLCFIDRLAYALQSDYREQFMADIASVTAAQTPLIFHRSASAWNTHPQNYRQIEAMVTRVGEWILGRTLDFGWSHLALTAQRLRQITPCITRSDFVLFAEMVLALWEEAHTKEVDWLAWEDPFIHGRDAAELKRERENSQTEIKKRLGYAIPMMQLLIKSMNNEQ